MSIRRKIRQSLKVPQPSDVYNYKGQTCLHIAAQNGFTDLVKYLIETRFHADVNAPERLCGKTILHLAAELGNLHLVKYLLALKKTDCHALTYSGHNALDLALGKKQHSVAEVLQKAQVKPQHMEFDEDDSIPEESEDDRDTLTLQDFQFSLSRDNAQLDSQTDYDDICIGGKISPIFLQLNFFFCLKKLH